MASGGFRAYGIMYLRPYGDELLIFESLDGKSSRWRNGTGREVSYGGTSQYDYSITCSLRQEIEGNQLPLGFQVVRCYDGAATSRSCHA
jgi:hypothetical protein